jgi:GMP synthase (glutamine-hydrolysing)
VRSFGAKGVILSGSHLSAYDERTRSAEAVFELGVPVLGICYGMQTMAHQLGGKVEPGKVREFGFAEVRARGHTQLLDGIDDSARRRPRHAQGLDEPRRQGRRDAAGLHADGIDRSCPIAAMADEKRGFYACSSIPRSRTRGRARRSCIASCTRSAAAAATGRCPTTSARRSRRSASRSARRGDPRPSGGVDSSVAAALIHKAIGDQLTCVFVDHGLLRLDEAKEVMATSRKHMHVKVIHVDASREFYGALEGVTDPEAEAQDHRQALRRSVPARAAKVKNAKWLAQGRSIPT